MKITKSCLFCQDDSCLVELYPQNFQESELNEMVFSARRVTEHFHYKMVRCKNTGLIFSREILPENELSQLYAGSTVTFSAYTDIIRKDYWRPLAGFKADLKRGSALEIGCSSGFFLEELQRQGFSDVRGCEPSLEAKSKAAESVRENIYTGFFTNEVYADNTFDLICSFQTLDHLSDPLSILRTCYRKLKPGGLIYIIVHNVDSLQYKIFGEKSPIIDVEHIYLFNPKTLRMAMEKAGLKTLRSFPLRNSYPLEYLVTHSPLPLKKQILSLVRAVGLGNLALSLRLGNMGIVARKE